jgi:ribosomal-protein-alanine N-acetyltransferase
VTTTSWHPVRTERLLLRDFVTTDFDAVHAYACDPDVARYMEWGPNTLDETRIFLDRALSNQQIWPRLHFGLAIELIETGEVIGSIDLRLRDAAARTAEIGYCLRQDHWRRGVVSEAARALVEVAFKTLGLHRVIATCDARNTGSFSVMEKLGMRHEGLFRLDKEVKGAWRDTYLYAVLAEEWGDIGK